MASGKFLVDGDGDGGLGASRTRPLKGTAVGSGNSVMAR